MKIQEIDSDLRAELEEIRADLRGIDLSGSIELFYLVKNPIYGILKYSREQGASVWRRCLFSVRESLRLVVFLLRRLARRASSERIPEITGKYVFVVDHPYAKDIKFQERILSHFNAEAVTILTESPLVKSRVGAPYANRLREAYAMIYRVELTSLDYVLWLKATARVRRAGAMFLPHLAFAILRAILYVRLYESVLSARHTRSVVTHADNHMHEYAISAVAAAKGICTYTNQHGLFSHLFVPVVSQTIFVWGEVFKRQLCAMGVPERKIVAVGRVLQPQAPAPLHESVLAYPRSLAAHSVFEPSALTVAYFATDYGAHENLELFKAFSSLLSLPVNVLIRPRPTAPARVFEHYARWVRQYCPDAKARVVISNVEDFDEVLAHIDVLVTCHSGSVLDAMPYGVVGIVLDLFEYMNLPAHLPYYGDMIVCKDGNALRSTVQSLAVDPEYLREAKIRTLEASRKYFDVLPGRTPDERTAELILRT